jgi:hypothetical protein
MTAAQLKARANFKKAIAYRTKTGCSLKEAFAHVKGGKVTGVRKVAAKKKVLKKSAQKSGHKDNKSHNVNIKVVSGVGALPIDFKGSFLGYKFYIANQYQLDGSVTAQLIESEGKGNLIASLSGNPKENERTAAALLNGAIATGGRLSEKDERDIKAKIKRFVTDLNKEVAKFNSGKDISKKTSKGLKIVYKPTTKKLSVVDEIKTILRNNKKILKGGYKVSPGKIREKVSGISVINGIKKSKQKILKRISVSNEEYLDILNDIEVFKKDLKEAIQNKESATILNYYRKGIKDSIQGAKETLEHIKQLKKLL